MPSRITRAHRRAGAAPMTAVSSRSRTDNGRCSLKTQREKAPAALLVIKWGNPDELFAAPECDAGELSRREMPPPGNEPVRRLKDRGRSGAPPQGTPIAAHDLQFLERGERLRDNAHEATRSGYWRLCERSLSRW